MSSDDLNEAFSGLQRLGAEDKGNQNRIKYQGQGKLNVKYFKINLNLLNY
jgi:hypothetical protein